MLGTMASWLPADVTCQPATPAHCKRRGEEWSAFGPPSPCYIAYVLDVWVKIRTVRAALVVGRGVLLAPTTGDMFDGA